MHREDITCMWIFTREEIMKILLISGTHGNEQAAVYATSHALLKFKMANNLSEVEYVTLNIPGLNQNTREMPKPKAPNMDFNRAFGCEPEYDINDITKALKERICDWATAVVDVHNSPACDNAILVSNDKFAPAYIRFAIKHGIHYMLRESSADTIKRYAIYSGRIGFTVEMGGMGFAPGFKDTIAKQTDFVYKLLDALDDEPTTSFLSLNSDRHIPQQYNMFPLHAHYQGIVRHLFAPGDSIKQGDTVFEILNPNTTGVLEEIIAPCDCILADCDDRLWSTPGMEVCSVQPIIPKEIVNG